MSRLYLASRSPVRLKLLRDAGLAVETCATRADEAVLKARLVADGAGALEIAQRLAAAKALGGEAGADALVLGADQTLDLDGVLFDKPKDLAGLRDQLDQLCGRTHHLHSAAVLSLRGRPVWQGASSVRLTMRPLSQRRLNDYVAQEGAQVLDCVGGYRFEGPGVQLFEAVDGDHFSILGLPLLKVLAALRDLGAIP